MISSITCTCVVFPSLWPAGKPRTAMSILDVRLSQFGLFAFPHHWLFHVRLPQSDYLDLLSLFFWLLSYTSFLLRCIVKTKEFFSDIGEDCILFFNEFQWAT